MQPGHSRGPSPAETSWRLALRAAGYAVAPAPVRFHWSSLADPCGDPALAEDAYRAFAEAEPGSLVALNGLAYLLQRRGDVDALLHVRRRIAEVEVREMGVPEAEREATVAFLLAKDGHTPAPAGTPPAYIASRFDGYAKTYDEHLLATLGYRGHEVVCAAAADIGSGRAAEPPFAAALDAGCGTGLAGELLRPLVGRLDGVDLSPRMLDRARARVVYDDLTCGDLVDVLSGREGWYDLVVAADVFTYVGDLTPPFEATTTALRAGGAFVFTVLSAEGDAPRLQPNGHYAHPRDYVFECAADAGLEVVRSNEAELRREHDVPVQALCFVLRPEPVVPEGDDSKTGSL